MNSVAIVDDHALVAQTLRLALGQHAVSARIVEPAATADVVADLLADRPDLVLLDLDLGRFGSSTPTVAALVAAGLRVLLVTGSDDRIAVAEALAAGAVGIAAKAAGFDHLVDTVRRALDTDGSIDLLERAQYFDDLQRHRVARDRSLAPFRALTEREDATLRALADGLTVPEIAKDWVVSEATVRTHVRGVLTKLGATTQLAAVATARRAGWLAGTAA
jgi:DNA-binding NarL/FixJ family response regulator